MMKDLELDDEGPCSSHKKSIFSRRHFSHISLHGEIYCECEKIPIKGKEYSPTLSQDQSRRGAEVTRQDGQEDEGPHTGRTGDTKTGRAKAAP